MKTPLFGSEGGTGHHVRYLYGFIVTSLLICWSVFEHISSVSWIVISDISIFAEDLQSFFFFFFNLSPNALVFQQTVDPDLDKEGALSAPFEITSEVPHGYAPLVNV